MITPYRCCGGYPDTGHRVWCPDRFAQPDGETVARVRRTPDVLCGTVKSVTKIDRSPLGIARGPSKDGVVEIDMRYAQSGGTGALDFGWPLPGPTPENEQAVAQLGREAIEHWTAPPIGVEVSGPENGRIRLDYHWPTPPRTRGQLPADRLGYEPCPSCGGRAVKADGAVRPLTCRDPFHPANRDGRSDGDVVPSRLCIGMVRTPAFTCACGLPARPGYGLCSTCCQHPPNAWMNGTCVMCGDVIKVTPSPGNPHRIDVEMTLPALDDEIVRRCAEMSRDLARFTNQEVGFAVVDGFRGYLMRQAKVVDGKLHVWFERLRSDQRLPPEKRIEGAMMAEIRIDDETAKIVMDGHERSRQATVGACTIPDCPICAAMRAQKETTR